MRFTKGCLLSADHSGRPGEFSVVTYQVAFRGSKPANLPVKELPPEQLQDVQQRVDQFDATPAAPIPTNCRHQSRRKLVQDPKLRRPRRTTEAEFSPARQLSFLSALPEINGLISSNPKSRGHAYVSLSGNTATVEVSVPCQQGAGVPTGRLCERNLPGISTDGPTPISALQVSEGGGEWRSISLGESCQ